MTEATETREERLRRVLEAAQRESMARDRRRSAPVTLAGAPLLRREEEAGDGAADPFDNVPV